MQFNRRGFLMSVIGAVMTGTVADLKVTKAALADPVVGCYAMTVKLQQGLYAANRKLLVARESQKDILRQQASITIWTPCRLTIY